ncbi:serine/threonine protein phosphatase 1 [Gemmobacter caeni]|uniref:Serine/threonine protein phosphatase 1 n=1 Tax=Gemmobacter caeni TaxID=589035 RepID=A0A2T6B8U5_9RHOB|nr:metallophosphoesterase [Gemmobacter caeni]PTX52476.1 serine/threonine protein phosphatase 1 [Gemmobacter caeni]TWJ02853.1 serine/threonine protein phosphatase 1 [Gemmobacter caeni]
MQMWTDWRPFPGRLPNEQIFVIGDVHGRGGALEMALAAIYETPRAAPRRRLVSLGDLIDRGPANLYAIEAVLAGRDTAGVDRVDLLPGNHELVLLDAVEDPTWVHFYADIGGLALIDELDPKAEAKTAPDVARMLRERLPNGFLDRVRAARSHLRIGDLVLVHGGLYPTTDETVQAGFLAQGRVASLKEHWAWIRAPFLDWEGGWDPGRRMVVLHGHTSAVMGPVHPDLYFEAADRVITHRRLNLDAGSAGCEQVAVAELRGGDDPVYRIGMFRSVPALGDL